MRTIAIVNQKGGCGKTTTTVNLAGALADRGVRVLVVDVDPQAHATLALGIDPERIEANLYEVLADEDGAVLLGHILLDAAPGIQVAPSDIALSALEQKLASERATARTERLAGALATLDDSHDFVLIDCPPHVGVLTFNALRAAHEVIVPLETSWFAIQGAQKLLETLALLSERLGHRLDVRILPTLYDGRTRYARETLAEIRTRFGEQCFDTVVRQNVKLREAARRGVPVGRLARSANGAADYAALALEVAADPMGALDAPTEASPPPPLHPEAAKPPVNRQAEKPPADRWAAQPRARQVEVSYRDASARDVRIAGDFNDWVPDKDVRSRFATDGDTRVWTKVLSLAPGTYHYRYVVDGRWTPDPANPRSEDDPVGTRNSVLVVS